MSQMTLCSPETTPYTYLPYTKSKRNSLSLYGCQTPDQGSFGDGWPELEYLTFSNKRNIGPLKREHFSGLNNLRSLLIFINSTHDMPDDIFNDLTKLKELQIHVLHVNKKIFKNLHGLEVLRIQTGSRESMDNFDTREMKDLKEFKIFEIHTSHLTRLTKELFGGCGNIEKLELNDNTIDAIDADAFEAMTSLKNVDFSFNKLSTLPPGLFSRNLNLEKVEIGISENLTSVPSGLLSNLPKLREIEINCKLSAIPSDFIHGSVNLELLNLENNELTSIPRDLLQNHTKLKIIRLFGNKFNATSPSDLFDDISLQTEVTFEYQSDY